jgi:hypothetical protein
LARAASTGAIIGAARYRAAEFGPSASVLRSAEGNVVDLLGEPFHLVQDEGRELFDLIRLLDIGEDCIGNACKMIQWGKRTCFAGGGEELDWTLSGTIRRDGRYVVPVQCDPRRRRAPTKPRRLRHLRRRRHSWLKI